MSEFETVAKFPKPPNGNQSWKNDLQALAVGQVVRIAGDRRIASTILNSARYAGIKVRTSVQPDGYVYVERQS